LITAYLVIGAFVSALIWVILIASKRRHNQTKNIDRGRVEAKLSHAPNAK
jgi:hypothetical protein